MCQHSTFRFCGLATAGLFALSNGAAAQAEQKSAKDLIAGTWILLIADNVRGLSWFGRAHSKRVNSVGTRDPARFAVLRPDDLSR